MLGFHLRICGYGWPELLWCFIPLFTSRGLLLHGAQDLFIPPRDGLSRKMWRLFLAGTARGHEISCSLTVANQKIPPKRFGWQKSIEEHIRMVSTYQKAIIEFELMCNKKWKQKREIGSIGGGHEISCSLTSGRRGGSSIGHLKTNLDALPNITHPTEGK